MLPKGKNEGKSINMNISQREACGVNIENIQGHFTCFHLKMMKNF